MNLSRSFGKSAGAFEMKNGQFPAVDSRSGEESICSPDLEAGMNRSEEEGGGVNQSIIVLDFIEFQWLKFMDIR